MELSKILDLVAAPALLESFMQKRGEDIAVNAEQVQRLGAQCFQILLSAKKTWGIEGHSFHLDNPSPAFLEAVELMGGTIEDLTYLASESDKDI